MPHGLRDQDSNRSRIASSRAGARNRQSKDLRLRAIQSEHDLFSGHTRFNYQLYYPSHSDADLIELMLYMRDLRLGSHYAPDKSQTLDFRLRTPCGFVGELQRIIPTIALFDVFGTLMEICRIYLL
jgi:hypothetical protein